MSRNLENYEKVSMYQLDPEDRYRVVTFSSSGAELTRGWVTATPEHAQRTIRQALLNLLTD